MTTSKKSKTSSESLPGLRGDPATHRPRFRIQLSSDTPEEKESRMYDSLVGDTPYVSKDRSLCHPWLGYEAFNLLQSGKFESIRFDKDNFVEGIPIKELEKYENKNMVYVVEASYQMQRELCRWVNEEMTKDTLLYYVYARYACESRLKILDTSFDNLITHLQWYKPEVANTLKVLYDEAIERAKATDAYYHRLAQLPYYNEANYNSGKVKALITRLIKKLRHIESMAYAELQKVKPVGPLKRRGKGVLEKHVAEELLKSSSSDISANEIAKKLNENYADMYDAITDITVRGTNSWKQRQKKNKVPEKK